MLLTNAKQRIKIDRADYVIVLHYQLNKEAFLVDITASNSPIVLRGRLKGPQLARLQGLLNMAYTPVELAKEIGFTRRQVYRVYEPLGCPFERDETGHIWINGVAFREWIHRTYPKTNLAENETFCLTCKQGVEIINPYKETKGGLTYLVSYCPHCGRKLTRITEKHRRK